MIPQPPGPLRPAPDSRLDANSVIMRKYKKIIILPLLIASLLMYVYWSSRRLTILKLSALERALEPIEEFPTRFLYLLQTESCLPNHLKPTDVIGNDSTCQCDVLVLSYRSMCNNDAAPHIEYIFNSSTTWATGRNLLYEVAQRRTEKYLYYIFMDDDVHLSNKTKTKTTTDSWRKFENFLKRIEPAVGVVDQDSGCRYLPVVYKARKDRGCKLEEGAEYVPTPRFDACFNAFHYKAVNHILPYTRKFDNISWWYSAVHAEIKSEVLFQGHVVIYTELLAVNIKHRPYKRKKTW